MNAYVPIHPVLPGRLGLVVNEVTYATQAPIQLVTSVALAAAAIAVQSTCTVARKPGLEGPVSLFLLTICESGERKSAVQAQFFKPFADQQRCWHEEAAQKASEQLIERQIWKEKSSALRAELRRAARQGNPTDEIEKRLRGFLEAEPKAGNTRKLIYEDTTPEALLAGLHTCGNSAALVHDEFGHFVDGSMSKKLPLLNSIWSGSEPAVDRKTVDSFVTRDPRLTCLFQAQPAVFQRFMDKQGQQARGNGFLARTLMSSPPSTQGGRFDDGVATPCEHLAWFHDRCRTLLNRSWNRVLRFTPDAQRLWHNVANEYEATMQPGWLNSDIRDFASKAAEHIARIAAVLHGFMNDESDEISVDFLQAAIDLVEIHRQQFKTLMLNQNQASDPQKDAGSLYNWIASRIQSRGLPYMEYSYIMIFGPHKFRRKEKLNYLLDLLESLELILIFKNVRKKVVQLRHRHCAPIAQDIPRLLSNHTEKSFNLADWEDAPANPNRFGSPT